MADDVTKKQEEAAEIVSAPMENAEAGGDPGYRENFLNSMYPGRADKGYISNDSVIGRDPNKQYSADALKQRAAIGRKDNAMGLPVSQDKTFDKGYIHGGNKPGASGGGPGRVSGSSK